MSGEVTPASVPQLRNCPNDSRWVVETDFGKYFVCDECMQQLVDGGYVNNVKHHAIKDTMGCECESLFRQ